jgi:hypothetical protein
MTDFTKKVDELNPAEIPMVETDFGLWLLAQKKKPSSRQMVTIPLYLETLGYERGKDVIDSRVISNLGYPFGLLVQTHAGSRYEPARRVL